MSRRLAQTLVAAGVLVLVVVLGVATVAVVRHLRAPDTDFGRAVQMAPPEAQRYTFTDWAGVRDALDLRDSSDSLGALLRRGFSQDLTSASGLLDSAKLLDSTFGWSPATAQWELLAQAEEGSVEIVRLDPGTDFDDLADRLRALGYTAPSDAEGGETSGGVWVGGDDVLGQVTTRADETGNPMLQNFALDADAGLVFTSNTSSYLQHAVRTASSQDGPSDQGLRDAVSALGTEPLSAIGYTGDQVCSELAMGQADADAQQTGARLVTEAGGVSPLAGFVIADLGGRALRVEMSFESDQQARDDVDPRAKLAAGPAPGQGGSFAERFSVDEASATGTVITLDLTAKPQAYALSDLSSGPVLFATC
ncbi:hypothetical protein [Nocardioides acrostichi]|uniref:Uncharacterized protein n=1 Tax=Nocardioides acrostichi TaxID=2784339 RepID=A0A930V2J2_9ACTN|nr:hypothetical protein [Nocardioides acrostichi]MBF4162570.1 hypothetical protein [Nocardioides acrostichi]